MIYRIDSNNKPVPVSNPSFSSVAMNVPVGFMMMYAGTTIPEGFMTAMGQSLSRADYPELFEIIGTRFGAEDDEHFSLPDTRETAIVGAGTNSKSTCDVYNVGQFKGWQMASHTHAQAPHTHSGASHTHSLSHTHTLSDHCHSTCVVCSMCWCQAYGICAPISNYSGLSGVNYTCAFCGDSCTACTCLTQAVTVGVCSATATTCASGASSGGTHGKRMGIYYIIKVEADK